MTKLLFTGASGFIGKNITSQLKEKYDLKTLGMETSNDYNVDISREIPSFTEKFDIVLHTAGKAHVLPRTKTEEYDFFNVNYQGTVNLCKKLEETGLPETFIFLSTVAVYGCEYGNNITEDHPLNAETPYARSKIMAEEFLMKWSEKNGVRLSILRPSLIAGVNPTGNLGAMIEGIAHGRYFSIRKGKAHKSILMVNDLVRLIPYLEKKGGIYNICDNENPTFNQLEDLIARQLNRKRPLGIPYWVAFLLAKVGDMIGSRSPFNTIRLKKMTGSLTFSNEKARKELNWEPLNVLEHFKIGVVK